MSLCRERQLVFIYESIMYGGISGKEETQETRVRPLGQKIPWRRNWQLTPVFYTGKPQEQRGLEGYSPRGLKESDMTQQLNTRCILREEAEMSLGKTIALNPILENLKSQNKDLALAQLAGESCRDSYLLNLLNLGYILER